MASVSLASSQAKFSNKTLNFDISAQPLGEALKSYASITQQSALARSEWIAGKTSTAVSGNLRPQAALQQLLLGTGLTAQKMPGETGGFVLKPLPKRPPMQRVANLEAELAGYPALLQAHVWQALCNNPLTRPGTYQSLLRLHVDAVGQLQRIKLIGSTGDPALDAAIQTTLETVRLNRSPPASFPQPLTLLIEPHAAGGPRCHYGVS